MTGSQPAPSRSAEPSERYRLYLDESGDHVYNQLEEVSHRYLCLLGCWFRANDYEQFHDGLESLKRQHFPHSPDEPVVLHREDMINRRKSFWRLRDPMVREAWDADLLELIGRSVFRVAAVVIDKGLLRDQYPTPAHPYHLALGFMLQRYCGFLNHVSRQGDVMAESRGGTEDRLLKDSYVRVHQSGAWMVRAPAFQRALTSGELKLRPKSANTAGLQLADLLGHPVRQHILIQHQRVPGPLAPFAARLLSVVTPKLNRHLYTGRVEGYGTVLFPTEEK
jgi:hypothetical protein